MDDRDALLQLAAALKRHDWPAKITIRGGRQVLQVTNPDDPWLNEKVICDFGNDEPTYRVLDGHTLGPITDADKVTDKLIHLLRSVGL